MNKFLIIMLLSFSGYTQTLVKAEKEYEVLDVDHFEKIYSTNYNLYRIYKIDNETFLLYSGADKYLNRIITLENLKELQRASQMIIDANKDDKVVLETFPMEISKTEIVGPVYNFKLIGKTANYDFSDLSYEEFKALSTTSDVNSVESDGEKVIDKVKTVTQRTDHIIWGLSKGQLKKLIELKF